MDLQLRNFQKKRTANFREDETKLLIELWGSPVIQNKLFLTHRKAPVMRILASNMQQRGFYRTPDEIKTRIRNLKCLYHRIKRTMQCGTGIGTVDPDWPHFKAMDAILSKENTMKLDNTSMDDNNSLLEGPRCEDIKQEIEDIDIHDDMESMATNDSIGSEYDETPSPPPLKPAPNDTDTAKGMQMNKLQYHHHQQQQQQSSQKLQIKPEMSFNKKLAKLAPNITMTPAPTLQRHSNSTNTNTNNINGFRSNVPSIPLLILNSVPQQNQEKDANNLGANVANDKDIGSKLSELIDIQREKLKVEQKKLSIEKQRLDFERLVGAQLLTLIPMVGELVKHLSPTNTINDGEHSQNNNNNNNKRKRKSNADKDVDAKYMKSLIQERIKNYITDYENNLEDNSDNDDDMEDEDEDDDRKNVSE